MSTYRYLLTRRLADPMVPAVGTICWVMCNPSTADDSVDDNTIRKVKSFSWREGFRDLVVVNLFAARATKPVDLITMEDPVGPGNDIVVGETMTTADAVVFAWGAWPSSKRAARLPKTVDPMSIAEHYGINPLALGVNKDGSPWHPLYIPGNTKLVPYTSLLHASA